MSLSLKLFDDRKRKRKKKKTKKKKGPTRRLLSIILFQQGAVDTFARHVLDKQGSNLLLHNSF